MSSGREGFLSRWSRLKREPDPAPRPVAPAGVDATEEPALPEGKTLDALIAELPRIEDLVPGQSLTAFMQPWVPNALRNAALQRMWLLDPAIRDYVNPALDYAYDYNTPGAAHGFGPLEATPDSARDVADMFDRALGGGRAGGESTADAGRHDNLSQDGATGAAAGSAAQQEGTGQSVASAGATSAPAATGRAADLPWQERSSDADAAMHNSSSEMKELRLPGRRHGGALPG